MRKIMLSILILSIVVFSFSGCAVFEFLSDVFFHDDLEEYFAEWEETPNDDVAIWCHDNTLLFNGEEIDVATPVYDYYGYAHKTNMGLYSGLTNLQPIVCMYEKKVYIVYSYRYESNSYRKQWDLLTLDIETHEVAALNANPYSFSPTSLPSYETKFSYYYYKSVIYVYDGMRTVSYDLESGDFHEGTPEEFVDCAFRSIYEVNTSNTGGIKFEISISLGEQERKLNLDYLAERNRYLYDLREKILAEEDGFYSTAAVLFIANVFVLEEDIYIMFGVRDTSGGVRMLFFAYDFETEEVSYLYSEFTIEIDCSMVPIKVIRKE